MGIRATYATCHYPDEYLVIVYIRNRDIFDLEMGVAPDLTTNKGSFSYFFTFAQEVILPGFPLGVNNQCLHAHSICKTFLLIFPLPVFGSDSLISNMRGI